MAGNMVRKLPLEVRKRLCGYVLGKPLVVMLSVVTWKIEHVLSDAVDLAEEGHFLPVSGPLHNLPYECLGVQEES